MKWNQSLSPNWSKLCELRKWTWLIEIKLFCLWKRKQKMCERKLMCPHDRFPCPKNATKAWHLADTLMNEWARVLYCYGLIPIVMMGPKGKFSCNFCLWENATLGGLKIKLKLLFLGGTALQTKKYHVVCYLKIIHTFSEKKNVLFWRNMSSRNTQMALGFK